ncbi:DUF1932 domain-containing protein [Rhizobiaceae bacterium BDR2-2]|uniref:DUF1932 domain-containing protein n=1 Tax=Ectorhizobium quercum TaxID=2965071 RepID=A0AAE3MZE2_9HYPH|nr:NAD(P)-dependent oxidoreductase [Ectorhizobium quercum]MCX8998118.1 DUF1932 domain-containing protein [Ectorhizobium quercum]
MKIAMLGFGEAARAIVAGWRESLETPPPLSAFDIKHDAGGEARAGIVRACADLRVRCAPTVADGLAEAGAVFSLVTADRALEAAESAAVAIGPGTLYLDGNSCAPSTKQAAAGLIEAAGGRYVDMAIMAPIHPARHRTPVLLAGEAAGEAQALLAGLDMRPTLAGNRVGQASAIKMLRSVMIKGLEALTAECLLAARRAGVEEAVLASLQASDPGFDWKARGAYNLERMMVHGARRAAEMTEVAVTLRDLGVPDRMTQAAAQWQRQIAGLALAPGDAALDARADRILNRLAP